MAIPHRARARVKAAQPTKPPLRVVADRLEPRLRRAVLAAIDQVKDAADLAALEEAVRANNTSQIRRLLDRYSHTLAGAQQVMGQAFGATGELTADVLSAQLGIAVSFSSINPRATQWMRRAGGRLISGMTEEGYQAVQTILHESFLVGLPPQATARQLREVLGLTDRLAQAVIANARRLREAGKTEAQIARASERYSTRLTNYRATVVARTEIISASAHGQQELWHQARDRGLIGRDAKRIWITTDDDRTCPVCSAMDGQEVGLDESFVSPEGDTTDTPPIHPACRCSMGLQP